MSNSIQSSKKQNGFTLIEILIVVAIIGILTMVALPAYQNSVLRSGRADAKTELLTVASDQERFFSANNSYSSDAIPLDGETANATRITQNGLYEIKVEACGGGTLATCFIATATIVVGSAQVDDICATLTLTSAGVRGATGTGATTEECWQR